MATLLTLVLAALAGAVAYLAYRNDRLTEERDGAKDALGMVLREQGLEWVLLSPEVIGYWYDSDTEVVATYLEDGSVRLALIDPDEDWSDPDDPETT